MISSVIPDAPGDGDAREARANDELARAGFATARVFAHGDVARIRLDEAEIERASDAAVRDDLAERLRALGFRHVALDLDPATSDLDPVSTRAVPAAPTDTEDADVG